MKNDKTDFKGMCSKDVWSKDNTKTSELPKEESVKTVADLIKLGFTNVGQQEDLTPGSSEYAKAEAKGDAFTQGVDMLRSKFPHKGINELMSMVWDLVGGKIVPLVGGMPVATLVFAVVGKLNDLQARIFVPDDYVEMVQKDGVHQLGALVFVGSQVVDFWNDKIVPQTIMIKRAFAYEAEFLHAFDRMSRDVNLGWKPNEYQKKVMHDYPHGIGSQGVFLYEYKPVPVSSGGVVA